MGAANTITAVVLMLLGGVVLFDAVRLGFGWGTDGPKSGFFPFWLAVMMMASCVVIAIQATRRPRGSAFVSREQVGPVLKVFAPATALVLATGFIGLYV